MTTQNCYHKETKDLCKVQFNKKQMPSIYASSVQLGTRLDTRYLICAFEVSRTEDRHILTETGYRRASFL